MTPADDASKTRWVNEHRWSLVFTSEDPLDATAERVAQSLEMTLVARDSHYLGGKYWRGGTRQGPLGAVVVQHNRELEHERREDSSAPTLVYLDPVADAVDRVIGALVAMGLGLFHRQAWPASQE